jgi:uncharacterized protein YecE (DUF72 family)
MKFGKVDNINNINFKLPPEDPSNQKIFLNQNIKTEIYLGATGWSMKEWKGKIYPEKTKQEDFLYHYSRQFNSIELNSTHYTCPRESTIQKWYDASAEDFKFCPKMWKFISHRNNLGLGTDLLSQFLDAIVGLREKLGVIFMQLPPYYNYANIDILKKFLGLWPSGIQLAIEARHESFYQPDNFNNYLNMCRIHKAIPLITDVAGRRDILHSSLGTDAAMIRWVGNGLHPTDYSRIDQWSQRIKEWVDSGIKSIYFFPHEPDNLLTPEIAIYLVKKIKPFGKLSVRGPRLNDSHNQLSLL